MATRMYQNQLALTTLSPTQFVLDPNANDPEINYVNPVFVSLISHTLGPIINQP